MGSYRDLGSLVRDDEPGAALVVVIVVRVVRTRNVSVRPDYDATAIWRENVQFSDQPFLCILDHFLVLNI